MLTLKYTVLFVAVIAGSLRSTNALSEEEQTKFQELLMPAFEECGKEHGTTKEKFMEAKEKGDIDAVDSCFLACVFKKGGIIDDKGMFDASAAVEKSKKIVLNEEEVSKFEEVGKDCAAVNEEAVGDGEAGCDRAKLLLTCFLKHKQMMHT